MSDLSAWCEQVSRDLGIGVQATDDGLDLPFATIFPRARHTAASDGWIRFGCDNYLSDFLCCNDSLAMWDREIGGPVEATHRTRDPHLPTGKAAG